MNQFKIKQLLAEKGVNLSVMARVLGTTPASVSQVISRKMTSTRIAKAISETIGHKFEDVFPEYAAISPKIILDEKSEALKVKELQKILG